MTRASRKDVKEAESVGVTASTREASSISSRPNTCRARMRSAASYVRGRERRKQGEVDRRKNRGKKVVEEKSGKESSGKGKKVVEKERTEGRKCYDEWTTPRV